VFLAADPAPVDVPRELAAMRAELAAIRVRQRDGWMDEERAREIRAIVRDALADSSTRASFLAEEWTVGYDHGNFVRSADGATSMKFSLMNQVRFVFNSAGGQPIPGFDTQTRWGMENRRVNLTFSGNVADPSVSYLCLLAYQSQADRFVQEPGIVRPMYAWVAKDFGHGWTGTVGLQNVPWDLESMFFGSSRLTTGEYSVFNYRFGAGKQPGATIRWQGESLRTVAGVFNQLNSLAERWNAPENLSFAVASRTELKIGADWQQLEWMSGAPGDVPGFVAGLGLCMSNGRAQNPQLAPPLGQPTPSAQGVTADLRAVFGGASLIGQFAYMRDPVGGPELGWFTGLNVQGSAFLTGTLEAFAAAAWMDDVPVEWIAEAGANIYLEGRALKLTIKAIVPFGNGRVGGIREIAGGLGIAQANNNASFVTQLQMTY
jgi:hypothetical protein